MKVPIPPLRLPRAQVPADPHLPFVPAQPLEGVPQPWPALWVSPHPGSGSLVAPSDFPEDVCAGGGGGVPERTHPAPVKGSSSKDRKRRLPLLPNEDSVGSSFPFSSFAFLFLLFHFVINHLWCWPDTLQTLFFAVHES